jgi:hypothetical protein
MGMPSASPLAVLRLGASRWVPYISRYGAATCGAPTQGASYCECGHLVVLVHAAHGQQPRAPMRGALTRRPADRRVAG